MKSIFTFILLVVANMAMSQFQQIKRLDGSTISTFKIDQIVTRLLDSANVHGLNLAILNQNKAVFIKSYGYKNKPNHALLDTSTIVYGASFSKGVFGYLVMKLVEEKTLDLDTPLYKYLKKPISDYEYFSDLKNDDRWKLITARMCLSHTTGLPNVRWFNPITGEQDTLGVIKIYFTPGSKYAYSGEGFKFLQLVIEEIHQKNTEELAQERIFKPLGMTRTGFIWHASFGEDNVAVGHMNNGEIDLKRKRTEPVAGGSLVTTISDYSKFIESLMQHKGLNHNSYEEMFSPQIAIHSKNQFPPISYDTTSENDAIHLSYGLGWGLLKCQDGLAFFKEGNGGSWRNYNINFIEKGLSIIIMTNSENGEHIFQEIIENIIADTCIPWKWHGYIPYDSNLR